MLRAALLWFVMLSEAGRRAKRSSSRSRSIPTFFLTLSRSLVMLSAAVRIVKRSSPRSRSIPTPSTIPFREPIAPSVTSITANPTRLVTPYLHVPGSPLLLHLHHGKPLRHPLHWCKRQPSQTHLPAQIPSLRRIHRPIGRNPPAVLGILRRRPQSPSPRDAAQRMDPRQENRPDRAPVPSLARPGVRMVSVDGFRKRKNRMRVGILRLRTTVPSRRSFSAQHDTKKNNSFPLNHKSCHAEWSNEDRETILIAESKHPYPAQHSPRGRCPFTACTPPDPASNAPAATLPSNNPD